MVLFDGLKLIKSHCLSIQVSVSVSFFLSDIANDGKKIWHISQDHWLYIKVNGPKSHSTVQHTTHTCGPCYTLYYYLGFDSWKQLFISIWRTIFTRVLVTSEAIHSETFEMTVEERKQNTLFTQHPNLLSLPSSGENMTAYKRTNMQITSAKINIIYPPKQLMFSFSLNCANVTSQMSATAWGVWKR